MGGPRGAREAPSRVPFPPLHGRGFGPSMPWRPVPLGPAGLQRLVRHQLRLHPVAAARRAHASACARAGETTRRPGGGRRRPRGGPPSRQPVPPASRGFAQVPRRALPKGITGAVRGVLPAPADWRHLDGEGGHTTGGGRFPKSPLSGCPLGPGGAGSGWCGPGGPRGADRGPDGPAETRRKSPTALPRSHRTGARHPERGAGGGASAIPAKWGRRRAAAALNAPRAPPPPWRTLGA